MKTIETIKDLIDAICYDERYNQYSFYRKSDYCIGVEVKRKPQKLLKNWRIRNMMTNVPFMLKEASKIAKLLEDLDQRYYRLEIFNEYITMTDIEIYDEEDHTLYVTITAKYKFYDEKHIEYSITIEEYNNINGEIINTINKDNITFDEMKAVLINTVTRKQED